MLDFDEDGFMRITPVGPWVVIEDDEDDTYELFDLGMAKRYACITRYQHLSLINLDI